jgi:hypothetical protein
MTSAEKLFDPLREAAEAALLAREEVLSSGASSSRVSHPQAAYLALFHFLQSIRTSQFANENGFYSVAVGLLRHSVESLTIVELGVSSQGEASRVQKVWEDGGQLGEVRKWLEIHVWPSYGFGLWEEPWREYFGNLAKAVQPYAHYSRQLLEWQFSVLPSSANLPAESDPAKLHLTMGVGFPDPVKIMRIGLFQSLLGWTLGRILLANRHLNRPEIVSELSSLGLALSMSDYLFKSKHWGDELIPTIVFGQNHPVS